jgi:hypothetical protein
MSPRNTKNWHFDRRINISVLIQIFLLASLIVGSWINLQRQLDLLQHNVEALLQNQKTFCSKLENLQATSISHEYRLQVIERWIDEGKQVE